MDTSQGSRPGEGPRLRKIPNSERHPQAVAVGPVASVLAAAVTCLECFEALCDKTAEIPRNPRNQQKKTDFMMFPLNRVVSRPMQPPVRAACLEFFSGGALRAEVCVQVRRGCTQVARK